MKQGECGAWCGEGMVTGSSTRRGGGRRGAVLVWAVAGLAALGVGSAMLHTSEREGASGEAEIASMADESARGWSAVYQSGAARVRTIEPWAAFMLGQNQSAHPAVPAGDLKATFSTRLEVPDAGTYRFGAVVRGGEVRVNVFDAGGKRLGEAVARSDDPERDATAMTEPLAIKGGAASVSVQFTRAGAEHCRVRTMWQRDGANFPGAEGTFPLEPIPRAITSVPASALAEASASVEARHGRVLMGELGCTHCHASGGTDAPGSAGHDHGTHAADAAVLFRPAPYLGQIGARANPAWLTAWVADPQKVKPGSAMPDVLGDSAKDRGDAEAITHFLVSMGGGSVAEGAVNEPIATEGGVLDEGRRLFHTVGCIACHGALESPAAVFGDPSLPNTLPEVSPAQAFGNLAGKWKVRELSAYLREPAKVRPAGRMPSMNLTQSEADLLAGYLVTAWSKQRAGEGREPAFTLDQGKVEAGRAAFAARGCANCHEMGPGRDAVASTAKAKAIAQLTIGAGCVSATPVAGVPQYTLSERDRKAISAAMTAMRSAPHTASAPIDETHRTIEALNCRACHEYDGEGGWPTEHRAYARSDEGAEPSDEGVLPPRLTGVGMKLTTTWLDQVLKQGGRARPYMHLRMPQFGAGGTHPMMGGGPVDALSSRLAAVEGVLPHSDSAEPASTDGATLAGKQLVGEKGMNCISCHVFGDGPAAGTRGPDLTKFAERLRYEWFKPYVLNPQRFKPGTRMTDFYPLADGLGVSKVALDGKAEPQVEALWSYFNLGELFMPKPEGLPSGDGMVLSVGERPIVLRTFLKEAGSRGIAVGYPSGMHFAYDASGGGRLLDAWRGAFIDASGAWGGRGGETAGGRGEQFWAAPEGPAIVIGEKPAKWPTSIAGRQFRGYTLDAKGVPTFRSMQGSVSIEERFEPKSSGGGVFKRVFVISGVPAGTTVWMNAGPSASVLGEPTGASIKAAGDGPFELTSKGAGAISIEVEVKP